MYTQRGTQKINAINKRTVQIPCAKIYYNLAERSTDVDVVMKWPKYE